MISRDYFVNIFVISPQKTQYCDFQLKSDYMSLKQPLLAVSCKFCLLGNDCLKARMKAAELYFTFDDRTCKLLKLIP